MPLEIRGVSKNDRLDAANKILDIVELQGWGNKFAHELSGRYAAKSWTCKSTCSRSRIFING